MKALEKIRLRGDISGDALNYSFVKDAKDPFNKNS